MHVSGTSHLWPDVSTLSLDAALQLDKIERGKDSDTSVLKRLVECLQGSVSEKCDAGPLSFNHDPLSADIYTSAMYRSGQTSVSKLTELQEKVAEVASDLMDVVEGRGTASTGDLKRFCLSLHEAILSEVSPFRSKDEPILSKDDMSASFYGNPR